MLQHKKNIFSIKLHVLFLIVLLAMAFVFPAAYALDTGDPRFEVWGYFQNDTAWHYTTNPGLNNIFRYKRVAPGLGNFGHPASFLINRLSRQNIVEHRD